MICVAKIIFWIAQKAPWAGEAGLFEHIITWDNERNLKPDGFAIPDQKFMLESPKMCLFDSLGTARDCAT